MRFYQGSYSGTEHQSLDDSSSFENEYSSHSFRTTARHGILEGVQHPFYDDDDNDDDGDIGVDVGSGRQICDEEDSYLDDTNEGALPNEQEEYFYHHRESTSLDGSDDGLEVQHKQREQDGSRFLDGGEKRRIDGMIFADGRAPYQDEIDQLPHPQSLEFDGDEEFYEVDDEHAFVEAGPPLANISYEQEVDVEHGNLEIFRNSMDQNYCDESSLSDDNEYGNENEPSNEPQADNRSVKSSRAPPQSPADVIHRIESVMESLLKYLDNSEEPILRSYVIPPSNNDDDDYDEYSEDSEDDCFGRAATRAAASGDPKFCRSFGNISQSRSFTSVCLVMSFIHALLRSNRTTTTREVYYVFVTHFRSQKECDSAILDVAKILGVSRRALGLSASPKGWFCGCVEITRKGTLPSGKDVSGSIDGTALSSIQGLPITREWIDRNYSGLAEGGVEITVSSKDAKVILVIEKEGVYNRLSEERIFDRFPCILVTGKGFPDLATRALVYTLHKELRLPVLGLCDANPYGVSILGLYHCAGNRMGVDGGTTYGVPIKWLGLRPSHVANLEDDLPRTVFQKLSDLDHKRIDALLEETNLFFNMDTGDERRDEILTMLDCGYKVELEALYWLGPDYMSNWIEDMLIQIDGEGEEDVAI